MSEISLKKQKELLKERLFNIVKNNDIIGLNKVLDTYKYINESFSETILKYKVEDEIKEYPSDSWYASDWSVIKDFQIQIYDAYKLAVENNYKEIALDISSYVYKVLLMSVSNQSLILFEKYRYCCVWFYQLSFKNENIRSEAIKQEITFLKELIDVSIQYSFREATSEKLKKKYNEFFYLAFTSINDLLKLMIDYKDIENFNFALEHFEHLESLNDHSIFHLENKRFEVELDNQNDSIIKKLDEEIAIERAAKDYYEYTIIGIQAWLWYCFRIKRITNEELISFSKQIKLPQKSITDQVEQFLFFNKYDAELFNWRNWGNEDKWVSGKTYTPLTVISWLPFYSIIRFIKEGNLSPERVKDIPNQEAFSFIVDYVKNISKYLKDNYEMWKTVLGNMELRTLEERSEAMVKLFESLKFRYERGVEDEIISQPISEEKVKKFKNLIYETWKNSKGLKFFFKKFGNIRYLEKKDDSVKLIDLYGANINSITGKKMFVDKHYEEIVGMEQFAYEVNRGEANLFLDVFSRNIREIKENYGNLNSALDALIDRRDKARKITNLIIMDRDLYREKKLYQNENFVPSWRLKDKNVEGIYGLYREIPILMIEMFRIKGLVIVCEFDKGFQMILRKNTGTLDDMLKVEVNEITVDKAKEFIKDRIDTNRIEDWMKNKDNSLKNIEELIHILRKSINIKILETCDFRVIDKNAIDVCIILDE